MTANNPEPTNVPVPRPPAVVAPVVSARAQLECLTGPEKGKKFRVAPGTTVIGRDPSCDVALTETPISRQHARIDRSADGWVLKNLSANGTRLNKKTVDEAPLVDGDVIGIGAKTRLRFAIETLTVSASGRPQFRARVAGMEEKEEEAPAEEGAPQSLFRRRKKLFIGLGAYALLMIALAAYLAVWGRGLVHGPDTPPELTLVDMLQLTPDSAPMRIISETADRYMVEDPVSGTAREIATADIKAGQARKIPGIRNSLLASHLEPANQANPTLSNMYVAQAEEMYLKRAQDPANLYKCVETFHRALAQLRNAPYLTDAKADGIRRAAGDELVDKVYTAYSRAVLEEKIGHADRAIAMYNEILNMIPDTENPVCKNIAARKGLIHKRNPNLKSVVGPLK